MYQSGRVGDEAKKLKSPAKSGRVGIYALRSVLPLNNTKSFKCLLNTQKNVA